LRDDMYRYPVRLATQAAFAGHPYGVPTTGDERTLPTITAEMLRAWHRSRVLVAPTLIALVGDAEPAELAALAAAAFGELRGGEGARPGEDVRPRRPRYPSAERRRGDGRARGRLSVRPTRRAGGVRGSRARGHGGGDADDRAGVLRGVEEGGGDRAGETAATV